MFLFRFNEDCEEVFEYFGDSSSDGYCVMPFGVILSKSKLLVLRGNHLHSPIPISHHHYQQSKAKSLKAEPYLAL